MSGTYGYQNLFDESVSNVTSTNSVALGTRRVEGGKEYVYVYNKSTSTALIGQGVCQSVSTGFSVTVSGAVGTPVFGVVQNNDLNPAKYAWVLVKGVGSAECEDSAVSNHTAATGTGLFKAADGGFGGITTGATGSTWAHAIAGTALESISTGASGDAYFNCYG